MPWAMTLGYKAAHAALAERLLILYSRVHVEQKERLHATEPPLAPAAKQRESGNSLHGAVSKSQSLISDRARKEARPFSVTNRGGALFALCPWPASSSRNLNSRRGAWPTKRPIKIRNDSRAVGKSCWLSPGIGKRVRARTLHEA